MTRYESKSPFHARHPTPAWSHRSREANRVPDRTGSPFLLASAGAQVTYALLRQLDTVHPPTRHLQDIVETAESRLQGRALRRGGGWVIKSTTPTGAVEAHTLTAGPQEPIDNVRIRQG